MIPNWIDSNEYPFMPKQFTLPMGQMNYIDEGEGKPIVMVHGNPSWSFEFRELIKHFSKTNRCIAPDHIGFGLSDKPLTWDYLPEHQATNLEQFLESLDLENITLLVGDWGGPIGLSYAIQHPERIERIIVTNSWMWSAKNDWYYQAFSWFVGGPIGRWLIRKYNFFANTVLKSVYGDKSKLTPEIHRHFLMPLAHPEERKGCWTFPKQIIDSSDWLADLWSKRAVLDDKIELIAWAAKDIAFRKKELNYWRSNFPDAKVVVYADAGHFVAEEKPKELIDELTKILAA